MFNFKRLAIVLLTSILILPISAQEPRYQGTESIDYGVQFQQIFERLRDKHVRPENVGTEDELFGIAIRAIMQSIGDDHGKWFTPDEFHNMQEGMRPSQYSGVGVSLAPGTDGPTILEIFDSSNLSMMGVHPGDTIYRAYSSGGTDVTWDGKNINALVGAIKGPLGTDVTLHIKRGTMTLGDITVQRVNARRQFVFMKMTDVGILTIRISSFSVTIYDDIIEQLETKGWLKEDGALNTDLVKAVVIDMRSNPGGALSSAVYTSDTFMEANKTAVRVIDPPNEESDGKHMVTDLQTETPRLFPNTIPRVILVNGLSASASEIVAGAARVHEAIPIFGTKTYGKGSVQTVFLLAGGSAMKTTTAIYLAGGTMEIDGIGIEPDSPVAQPPAPGSSQIQKQLNGSIIRISMDPEIDYQLAVAHAYLRAFLIGGHMLDSAQSVQSAMNQSHGVSKPKFTSQFCKSKGLRGCPAAGPPAGFGGFGGSIQSH